MAATIETSVIVLFAVLFLLVALNIVLVVVLFSKITTIRRNQVVLNRKFSGENVEDILRQTYEKQNQLINDVSKCRTQVIELQSTQNKNFDQAKIIRYSANPDNDAKLSFSLGITNEDLDGFVITGLYFKNGVNVYVKHLALGVPDMELSEEEKAVVKRDKRVL